MKNILTAIMETLWFTLLLGAVIFYAWQHDLFVIAWAGFLVIHTLHLLRKYSDIKFVTINNVRNVEKIDIGKDF